MFGLCRWRQRFRSRLQLRFIGLERCAVRTSQRSSTGAARSVGVLAPQRPQFQPTHRNQILLYFVIGSRIKLSASLTPTFSGVSVVDRAAARLRPI